MTSPFDHPDLAALVTDAIAVPDPAAAALVGEALAAADDDIDQGRRAAKQGRATDAYFHATRAVHEACAAVLSAHGVRLVTTGPSVRLRALLAAAPLVPRARAADVTTARVALTAEESASELAFSTGVLRAAERLVAAVADALHAP